MKTIKGQPIDKWQEVIEASRVGEFIYIASNGSKWAGQEPDDIDKLLEVLSKHPLDIARFGGFYELNPCTATYNPEYPASSDTKWIDGPRLFPVEGVVRFHGNFRGISHVFSIDTNHAETIKSLVAAIAANIQKQGG